MWDLEVQGKTAVCVAVDGAVRGLLGLADTAKAEAYSTIQALRRMNIDVWMVRTARSMRRWKSCVVLCFFVCVFFALFLM
jgi:high-affinity K+ transport system ATPase subunit B